jgi:anti-sigma B factor antagonist
MNVSVTDQIPGDALDTIRSTVEAVEIRDTTDMHGDTATTLIDSANDLVGTASKISVHGGRLHLKIIDGGISVAGEIDAHTCPDLAAALEPLPGSGDVRIDMAGVQFIDSSGLRVLIGAHQRAAAAKRKLLIDRPSKSVFRIIEITGLADHLHIANHA